MKYLYHAIAFGGLCKNRHDILVYTCFIAIEVSVKPASSSHVTTKRVTINMTGTVPAFESIENMSATGQKNVHKLLLCTSGSLLYCVGESDVKFYPT